MVVLKSRSYARCVREGLAVPFIHYGTILKLAWPFLLLTTVAYALLVSNSLEFVLVSLSGGVLQATAKALFFLLSFILFRITLEVIYWWHLRKWVELGYLPSVHSWQVWRGLFAMGRRVAVYILSQFLVFLPLGVLVAGYVYLLVSYRMDALPATIWVWIGLVVLGSLLLLFSLYLRVQAYHVAMAYLLGEERLWKAIRTLRWSRRYTGRSLAVIFLTGLAACVVLFPFVLPSLLCSYVDSLAFISLLEGDAVDLPTYYYWFGLAAHGVASFGLSFADLLTLYPFCLNWGALRCVEEARGKKLPN